MRPSSYLKIDNFYTATIYEKGAEVIRMLRTILGADAFRQGMDLYFDRWDGHATTVEAFIACFAEASGRDLSHFFKWYEQAGTPKLSLTTHWDSEARTVSLTFRQKTDATPGQPDKQALPIPIALGLMNDSGEALGEECLIILEEDERTITLPCASRPVVSALRNFSAPVNLTTDAEPRDAYVLLAHDPDLFNRWEAGQTLARDLILSRAGGHPDELGEERFANGLGRARADESAEPAFRALMLGMPTEGDLAMAMTPADPAALHQARDALRMRIAVHLSAQLSELHGALQETGEFSASAQAAGRRALRNACLGMLAADPHHANAERAQGHYRAAANMTDAMGGLSALMLIGGQPFDDALDHFYDQWRDEPLVVDKWFAIQAQSPAADVIARVEALTLHPAFDAKTPNRLRALVGAFASGNPSRFHDTSGAGYRFLAEQILSVDSFNPMIASRLIEPLGQWRRYRADLGQLMRGELDRILAKPGLSKNVLELAAKARD